MTGLVIGMLVSSAKASYDAGKNEVANMSTQIVLIDRLLSGYGQETAEIRAQFRELVESGVERVWPQRASLPVDLKPTDEGQILLEQMLLLEKTNDRQATAMAQAAPLILALLEGQWGMFLKTQQAGVPLPLFIVVVSWVLTIFFSFGLFVVPSPIVFATFAVGALAVSSAIFIIGAMNRPFAGAMKISPAPILKALGELR